MYIKAEVIISAEGMKTRYCTVDQFCRDNADDKDLCDEVRCMMDYESIVVGGGSSPQFTITRWK